MLEIFNTTILDVNMLKIKFQNSGVFNNYPHIRCVPMCMCTVTLRN